MSAVHSTVPFPFTSISGLASVPCAGCGNALVVPSDEAVGLCLCRRCRAAEACAEAAKLRELVRDLAHGLGAFAVLSADERREEMRQLGISVNIARLSNRRAPAEQITAGLVEYVLRDEPGDDDKAAIYAMEEILDREETLDAERFDGLS